MKKLLFIFLSFVIINAYSKSISNQSDSNALVITSDSSVGIRALQGGSVVTGKVVIQNSSTGQLKNLQLTMPNAPTDITLANGNCGDHLEAGRNCYYSVNYKPSVNVNKQNTEQLITFLASAEDTHGAITKDSYIMVMQSFANQDPTLSQTMNFAPNGDFIEGFKKGNIDLLYANGKGPKGISANSILLRSTDGWHWSVVGGNWQELSPAVKNIEAMTVNLRNHPLMVYSSATTKIAGIAEYDEGKWQVRSLESLNNSQKIQTLLQVISKLSKPLPHKQNVIITPQGEVYIKFCTKCDSGNFPSDDEQKIIGNSTNGLLKFNGNQWQLILDPWPYTSTIDILRQFNGVIYTPTNKGILKFDDGKWLILGKFDTKKWQISDGPDIWDILQTPPGDLYIIDHYHGVMKYDPKTDFWKPVGPEVEYGDGAGSSSLGFYNGDLYVDNSIWLEKYNPKTNQWEDFQKLDQKDTKEFYSTVPGDYNGFNNNILFGINGKFLYTLFQDYNTALYRYDNNRWVRIGEIYHNNY